MKKVILSLTALMAIGVSAFADGNIAIPKMFSNALSDASVINTQSKTYFMLGSGIGDVGGRGGTIVALDIFSPIAHVSMNGQEGYSDLRAELSSKPLYMRDGLFMGNVVVGIGYLSFKKDVDVAKQTGTGDINNPTVTTIKRETVSRDGVYVNAALQTGIIIDKQTFTMCEVGAKKGVTDFDKSLYGEVGINHSLDNDYIVGLKIGGESLRGKAVDAFRKYGMITLTTKF